MTDTFRFDDTEKIDILLKTSFGVPSTSEIKPWFQEDTIKFNPYLNGEHVFVDEIPKIPNFSNGTVRTATELNINSSNFIDYNEDSQDIDYCSIVDDETGIIRRYRFLILKETPQLGTNIGGSWYQTDNSNNNILTDSGGYQVFSLSSNRKINIDGVNFKLLLQPSNFENYSIFAH